jgi:hypothetical protein
VTKDHHARWLGATARDTEQHSHAQLLDPLFVDDVDEDAGVVRHRGSAARKLAGGEDIAWLVGQFPRQVTALPEHSGAGNLGCDIRR